MSPVVIVIGAGGFGRETLDVIEAMNGSHVREIPVPYQRIVLEGVADDAPASIDLERLASRDVRYLGTTDEVIQKYEPQHFVIGIGDPAVKALLDRKFTRAGWKPITVVHPHASFGTNILVGKGCVICGGVQLSTNTSLGRHVHLNPNSTIGHDSVLDDFVSVNPGSVVSGEVVVKPGALLGAGSVILQGLNVGESSIIGASACVVRDVERKVTVVGVPARRLLPTVGRVSSEIVEARGHLRYER